MNKFIFSLLLLLPAFANAQPPGFRAVDDIGGFKKRFAEEGKKINSIRSSFVQEKSLSLLEEKITSEGNFYYRRERKVRIEYQKPFRYLLVMNGDQILIRDEKKESRVSTHSNKLFQQINRIVVDCVNGSILDNKEFSPRIFQNDKTYLLEMSPTAKAMKEFFQTIAVEVDKKDWSVMSIQLREPGGDKTTIRFLEKVINDGIDDALFTR